MTEPRIFWSHQDQTRTNTLAALCMIIRQPDPQTFDDLLEEVFSRLGFDEYVFIFTSPDLESEDRNALDLLNRRIQEVLGLKIGERPDLLGHATGTSTEIYSPGKFPLNPTVKVGHFPWVDNFSAARNFSFEKATATWRGYLDADDHFDRAAVGLLVADLRDYEESLARGLPVGQQKNCVSFPYRYAADTVQPDVIRFVRWAEGWQWEDPIHEHLVRVPNPGTLPGRRIHAESELTVVHMKPEGSHKDSFERNTRIARKEHERLGKKIMRSYREHGPLSERAPIRIKRGRMAYFLGEDAMQRGDHEKALDYFHETAEATPANNMGAHAYTHIVRIHTQEPDFECAFEAAGALLGHQPELRLAWLLLGFVHASKAASSDGVEAANAWYRALHAFNHAETLPEPAMSTRRELWFEEGLVRAWHARAVFEVTQDRAKAEQILATIGTQATHPSVQHVAGPLALKLRKEEVVAATLHLMELYVWCDEPDKAYNLDVPTPVQQDLRIRNFKREVRKKLWHMGSAEAYFKAYAELPEEKFHTAPEHADRVLTLRRAQKVLNWALEQRMPEDGSYIQVLSIGAQDGYIEAQMLRNNPHIVLTFVDVGPQASRGFERLSKEFGGRVKRFEMSLDNFSWTAVYTWAPPEMRYAAVICFEVLEHLPDADNGLHALRDLLLPDGELFLSVPDGQKWIQPAEDLSFFPHVRTYSAHSLAAEIDGFEGTVEEAFDGTLVAHLRPSDEVFHERVAILVPGTPKPFGPFSHEKGFVGGSEECVIHLAAAMAAEGVVVHVFTPDCPDEQGNVVRYHEGVFWHPVEEFDPLDETCSAVFFWRCPQLLLSDWASTSFEDIDGRSLTGQASYKKILWLHDAAYGAPSEAYDRADEVIVLSGHHRECLERLDGWIRASANVADDGLGIDPPNTVVLANGIDPSAFPELGDDIDRDPHRIIYASSPDRGLQTLLEMWPEILKNNPAARLDIYYDWTTYEKLHRADAIDLREECESWAETITLHGGVSHEELHAAFRRANIWAYPHEGDVETFCITAVKAQASGCWPIVYPAGALPEVVLTGSLIAGGEGQKEAFIGTLLGKLDSPPPAELREEMRTHALNQFSWPVVAKGFTDLLP